MSDDICRVWGPGPDLVCTVGPSQGVWFAQGWDARRVAEMLAAKAQTWRLEQTYAEDADSLDEAQVSAIEASRDFFALLARRDDGEHVDPAELTAALAKVGISGNAVLAEEIWLD